MTDKTIWEIRDPREDRTAAKRHEPQPTRPLRLRKNPAAAFSLSLVIWGSGQVYNRQKDLGMLFVLLMANYVIFAILCIWFRKPLVNSLNALTISPAQIFLGISSVYVSALMIWMLNAVHAYRKAARTHPEPFEGVQKSLLPVFCSLLMPGWGQILNGQFKKACFFLTFTLFGLISVPTVVLAPRIWLALDSGYRVLFEKVLLAALVFLPLVAVIWLVGIVDALKTALDPLKKEPLHKRFEYAINRLRMKGWGSGLLPRARTILLLALLLAFVLAVSVSYFPRKDYAVFLRSLEGQLIQHEMTLIPDLIDRFLKLFFADESTATSVPTE